MKLVLTALRICVVVAIAASLTTSVLAQDNCSALLQHGIFENLSEIGASSSSSSAKSAFCSAYQQYESDSQHGDTSGKYAQLFEGNVSLSREQIKSIGEWMCTSSASTFNASTFAQLNRSIISSSAIEAWKSCVDQGQFLVVDTTFHDTDQGSTGFTISFHRGGASSGTEEINWIKTSSNLDCSGSGDLDALINKNAGAQPVDMGSKAHTLVCSRDVSQAPVQSGSRLAYADDSYVTISTSAGAVTRRLPAILPVPPPNPIPRGTIVAWYSPNGPIPQGWALCDGTAGNPDLRDRFIMGTGAYDQAGKQGGNNDQTISVAINRLDLAKGGANDAMRLVDGHGIISHTTDHPEAMLVDTYTNAATVTTKIDNRPAYTSIMYIIKQ
jgi:hypothetical protein